MSDPFVAEIRIVGFNFAPTGWAMCNGQLLPISQNTALFSLLGTFYGGDGKSTFALPNFQGSAPMNQGQGNGLSPRFIGEQSGSQTVTLLTSEMPSHPHNAMGRSILGNNVSPAVSNWAGSSIARPYLPDPSVNTQANPLALSLTGGSQPHNNMPPYLTLNFIIAMQGVFPPRG
jgi:microcystin-dependent protein